MQLEFVRSFIVTTMFQRIHVDRDGLSMRANLVFKTRV